MVWFSAIFKPFLKLTVKSQNFQYSNERKSRASISV